MQVSAEVIMDSILEYHRRQVEQVIDALGDEKDRVIARAKADAARDIMFVIALELKEAEKMRLSINERLRNLYGRIYFMREE